MEVFMRYLPSQLTEDGLRDQLEPILNQLGIIDYLREESKKKPFGFVTFLDERDGKHFLTVYGQETTNGNPRSKSRLRLIALTSSAC